jgi:tetratricopeptide (TPR) repeat protein
MESTAVEEAILSGNFKEAERISEEMPVEDIKSAALNAQLLIYKGELEEAERILDTYEGRLLAEANLKDAAEFGLAKAELSYWRGEFEEAERQAQVVFGIYSLNNDHFGLARSLYMLGRVCRRRGDFDRAEEYMLKALEHAESLEGGEADFLIGLISYNLGAINHNLGHFKQAESQYLKAIEQLKKAEAGRYYGNALNGYGSLLNSKGKYQEASEVIQEAYDCFSENACFDDLAHATNNLSYAYIRMGEFEEASKRLSESVELRRRSKDIAGESVTLELYGKLRFEQGNLQEAQQALEQAVEMAELAKNQHEKTVALITLGRVLLANREMDKSGDVLQEALRTAIELKNKSLQAEAYAYLAEFSVIKGNGVEALDHLKRTKSLINGYSDAYLLAQIERIEKLVQGEKVRSEEGMFSIKSSFLPTWREAHESLGKFLLTEALKHADDNQTRAAELLGVTKAYITMLRKRYGV